MGLLAVFGGVPLGRGPMKVLSNFLNIMGKYFVFVQGDTRGADRQSHTEDVYQRKVDLCWVGGVRSG